VIAEQGLQVLGPPGGAPGGLADHGHVLLPKSVKLFDSQLGPSVAGGSGGRIPGASGQSRSSHCGNRLDTYVSYLRSGRANQTEVAVADCSGQLVVGTP
jgi:hypothetical protein